MADGFMIYGATGYTGKLTARAAVARGLRPILGARNSRKLESLAANLGVSWRAFALDDPKRIDEALSGVAAVLNVAGPFSTTAKPVIDACLRTGTNYLDITGEIDVFEACAARDAEAKLAGVAVLPGVGFDVVPSDCLAAHMKVLMPEAQSLVLALSVPNGFSRGTAMTAIASIGKGTRVRREGKIVSLAKPLRRQLDFGNGPASAVAVGWGDIATAYYSTGIPDITVFFRTTGPVNAIVGVGPRTRRLLSTVPAQAVLRWLVRSLLPEGPGDAERAAGRSVIVGEATDATGNTVRSRLETPEAYSLTVLTSLTIVERVIARRVKPGFQVPSLAFGADFILEIAGTRRVDL